MKVKQETPANFEVPTEPPTVPLKHIFTRYNEDYINIFCTFIVHISLRYQSEEVFASYVENKNQMFKCMFHGCSFASMDQVIFQKHYGELHINLQSFRCSYCLSAFSSVINLTKHIMSEHGHCEYQCKYCLYRSHNRVYLRVHCVSSLKNIF